MGRVERPPRRGKGYALRKAYELDMRQQLCRREQRAKQYRKR